MIFSSAEIVKTSNDIRDRYKSLSGIEGVKAVAPANPDSQSSKEQAGGALLQFAKFNKPRPELRKPGHKLHRAFLYIDHPRGTMIDIYA